MAIKWKGFNKETLKHRSHPKFNVPVIGYSATKNIKYNSILDAEDDMEIPYHQIFDACIGRTYTAGGMHWEYENGMHWIKYHAKQERGKRLLRVVGFNG